MSKKKSKNKGNGQPPRLSPARYMCEKARTLPIGKCYIAPPGWMEAGIAHVAVTRVRPSGNLVMATFLVDTFCLGIKDAWFRDNVTPYEFKEYLDEINDVMGFEEISYNEAHNLIYGAIAFAEEAGIEPVKDFCPACYILEEDTDEIPLIEYEFGKNGKHLLVVNPDGKEMPYLGVLKKNLGDNFDFILPVGEEEEEYVGYDDEEFLENENPNSSDFTADE